MVNGEVAQLYQLGERLSQVYLCAHFWRYRGRSGSIEGIVCDHAQEPCLLLQQSGKQEIGYVRYKTT